MSPEHQPLSPNGAPGLGQAPTMTAHFIDVGQANATLLEFPCGAMLVDAGTYPTHAGKLEAYLTAFFRRRADLNRTLDVVLSFTTALFPTEWRGDAFAWANNLLGRIGYVIGPIVVGTRRGRSGGETRFR